MGKRVMVVDDSNTQTYQIEQLLEDTDFIVETHCKNGEEAIAMYGMVQPDIVMMDIIMPGLDGLETARAILEEYPDARIVMVSSLAYEDTIEEAKEIGAKAFLCKPISVKSLLETLEKALT